MINGDYDKKNHRVIIDRDEWSDGVPLDEGLYLVALEDPYDGDVYLCGVAVIETGPNGGKRKPYWLDGPKGTYQRFAASDGVYFWCRLTHAL